MAQKVAIEVYNLDGLGQHFEVDREITIYNLIQYIVNRHRAFTSNPQFNIDHVNWLSSRLIYNGKTLEHFRPLCDYAELVTHSVISPKLHIVVKGGQATSSRSIDTSPAILAQSHVDADPSSPVSIRSSSNSGSYLSSGNHAIARSFPGTSPSFLENQINRLDRRTKSDQIKVVSKSIVDLSQFLKTTPTTQPQTLDQILSVLVSIDQKLSDLLQGDT